MSHHDKAITYDLLTKTRYTLDDVGGELSWFALSSFIQNLGTDSALARDLGKSTGWEYTLQTNIILADIYDLVQALYVSLSGGKRTKKIKPYPRPKSKKGKEDDKKKIGKGALPPDQLHEWFENRRKEHGEWN